MAWQEGQKLRGGNYTIERILGRGYFGITYLVEGQDGKQLAIKTLSDKLLQSPDRDRLEERFIEEARRLSQCNNPHIVKVEEIFKEGDVWCIGMEYIDGVDLAKLSRNNLPLAESKALEYIQQIGEALVEVHRHQLVHRDVKPQNIMVQASTSKAVLIDFGLIQKFNHPLTIAHPAPDAVGFAPLEMYLSNRPCGAYTDVYALAATLYFLLTGQKPPAALDRKDKRTLVQPAKEINPKISDAVNQAIIRGMKLEADARPETMQEWLNLLPAEAKPVTAEGQKQRDPPLFWTKVSVWVAVVLGIIAAIPAWLPYVERMFQPTPTPPPTPTPINKPQK